MAVRVFFDDGFLQTNFDGFLQTGFGQMMFSYFARARVAADFVRARLKRMRGVCFLNEDDTYQSRTFPLLIYETITNQLL